MNISTATPREIDEAIADLETQAWKQSELIARALASLHYVVRDKQVSRTGWRMSDKEVLERVQELLKDDRLDFIRFNGSSEDSVNKDLKTIADAKAERSRLNAEVNRYEEEFQRRPWSRFFQLRSTADARIHDTRWCPGLHRSNLGDLGWHPELSGQSEEQAVAELGPVMCSKCFKSAPVEWRQDPKDLKPKDPNECPGTGERPIEGTVEGKATYSGYTQWGRCPVCEFGQTVRRDYTIAKHKKPKADRAK